MRVLSLLQLPPPIHGAAMRNSEFVNSEHLASVIDMRVLPIQTASSLSDVGVLGGKKLFAFFVIFFRLLWLLVMFRPNLVYMTPTSSGAGFYKDLLLVLACKLFFRKVVCHMRNRGLTQMVIELPAVIRGLVIYIYSSCEFIVMSEGLARDVALFSRRPHVVGNCLSAKPSGIGKEIIANRLIKPKIVFLSNICTDKGIDTFVDVAEYFIANSATGKYKSVVFEIYGPFMTEEDERYLLERIRRVGSSRIKYNGAIFGSKKFELLESSAALIFPTRYGMECFPGVIMEAFSCALPVVATPVAAIPDIMRGFPGCISENAGPEMYFDILTGMLKDNVAYVDLAIALREKYKNEMQACNVHPQLADVLTCVGDS